MTRDASGRPRRIVPGQVVPGRIVPGRVVNVGTDAFAAEVVVGGRDAPRPGQVHPASVPTAAVQVAPRGCRRYHDEPTGTGVGENRTDTLPTVPEPPDRTAARRPGTRRVDLRYVDREAVADGLPLFVPAIPFGFVVGVAIVESDMPLLAGWSTSLTIFAGASQLATVTLAGVASVWAVVVAALVINSRHVMYSAALAPTFRHQPRWFRWVAPFVLIDQLYALVALRVDHSPAAFRRYYLSLGAFFYLSWIVLVTIGMAVGPAVPSSWRLDLAPAIMFTGLVVVSIERAPAAVAAVVAAAVALVTAGLPDRLGIVVGAVAGVAAGAVAETRRAARLAGDDGGDDGSFDGRAGPPIGFGGGV